MHRAVFVFIPDVCQIRPGETAQVANYLFIIQHFVDCISSPLGFEDDGFVQKWVFLEVQAYSQIVQIAAQLQLVISLGKPILLADVQVFI